MKTHDYRQALLDVCHFINQHLIAEQPGDIYCEKGLAALVDEPHRAMPVTTTMLVLNSCLGNNTLIEGDVGLGKTRIASVVGSILYQLPIELFEWRRTVGSPGATVNEIYATHDLAALSRGEDKAYLFMPFHLPFLIIDELNRFSELEQNRIREGVANDVWPYANHSWKLPRQVVVSAVNPQVYGGTFTLNENLLDNFAIVLWPPTFNDISDRKLVAESDERTRALLGLEGEVLKFMEFYAAHKNDTKKIAERVRELQEKTLKAYQEKRVPTIHNGSLADIRQEVDRMPIQAEARLFSHALIAEMNRSKKYGTNRFEDPLSDDSHDKPYLSTRLRQGIGGRFFKDWELMTKALAWLMKKNKASIEEVRAAFIYTAPRRLVAEDDFFQAVYNSPRLLPLRHELARQAVNSAFQTYTDFGKPENPAFNQIRQVIIDLAGCKTLSKDKLQESLRILGRTDHPLARVIEEFLVQEFVQSVQAT